MSAERDCIPVLLYSWKSKGTTPKCPTFFGSPGYYTGLQEPFAAYDFSDVKGGDWVVKRGRTTGITVGVCHGTEVLINGPLNKAQSNKNFANTDRPRMRYKELVILNKRAYKRFTNFRIGSGRGYECDSDSDHDEFTQHNIKSQLSFCDAGDEGSVVYNERTKVAGLLRGALIGRCGPLHQPGPESDNIYAGAGIVTPMTAVLEDIARKTTRIEEGEVVKGSLACLGAEMVLVVDVERTRRLSCLFDVQRRD